MTTKYPEYIPNMLELQVTEDRTLIGQFNPNHGADGRFSSSGGEGSRSVEHLHGGNVRIRRGPRMATVRGDHWDRVRSEHGSHTKAIDHIFSEQDKGHEEGIFKHDQMALPIPKGATHHETEAEMLGKRPKGMSPKEFFDSAAPKDLSHEDLLAAIADEQVRVTGVEANSPLIPGGKETHSDRLMSLWNEHVRRGLGTPVEDVELFTYPGRDPKVPAYTAWRRAHGIHGVPQFLPGLTADVFQSAPPLTREHTKVVQERIRSARSQSVSGEQHQALIRAQTLITDYTETGEEAAINWAYAEAERLLDLAQIERG